MVICSESILDSGSMTWMRKRESLSLYNGTVMIFSCHGNSGTRLRAVINNSVHLLLLLTLATACATQSYHHESTKSFPIRDRAVTQNEGDIRISASVPGQDEAQAIFGVPLYKRGIQPVWLEIVNNSPDRLRFAPTSLDRTYFSPLEVAYMHRKGYSKEARSQMDQRFHESAMPRQIPAGETRSGYVFTHASPGTKSFNIDLFSPGTDYSFAFFVTVPGFVPDHTDIDFDSLYAQSDVHDYDLPGLRDALAEKPWVTTDQSGQQPGLPVGIIIVGEGIDVLKALLRAGWYESAKVQGTDQLEKAHYLFGRVPDAVFRIQRNNERDRNEMYLWMAPMRVDGKPVWMAQITHFIGQRTQLEQAIFGARIDPDIDDGRNYFMQNLWYSQSLEQIAWLAGNNVVSIENTRMDFNDSEYFTDGYRVVAWLSGVPVSLLETTNAGWDDPPFTQ